MQIKLSGSGSAKGIFSEGLQEFSVPLRRQDRVTYRAVGRSFGSYCVGSIIGEALVSVFAQLTDRVRGGLNQGEGASGTIEFNLEKLLQEISSGFGFSLGGGKSVGVHVSVSEEELKGGDFYDSAFELSCSPIPLRVSKFAGSYVVTITYPESEGVWEVREITYSAVSEVLVSRILGGGGSVFQNVAWSGRGGYTISSSRERCAFSIGTDSVEAIVHSEAAKAEICGDSLLLSMLEKVSQGKYNPDGDRFKFPSVSEYQPNGSTCWFGLEVPTLPVHIKELFWLDWEIKHNLSVGRTLVFDHTEELFMDDDLYQAFVQRLHELGVNVIVLSCK
jgi:hypothetical protein